MAEGLDTLESSRFPPMAAVPLLTGLAEIAERYDAYVVDLWGVLHDGITAFPAAIDCLREVKARGDTVVILSNAPRRADVVRARNQELGIDPALCDLVMSSGEEAWHSLATRPDAWYRDLGRRCYHLGPERDHGMREGLDYHFVADIGEADFVLATGANGPDDTVETFDAELRRAAARDLPMVCANPDLVVVRGGRHEICAGALAAHYEHLGGRVRYHGKPDPAIYRSCFTRLGLTALDRIAAIGDSLRTDVAGAAAAGIDAIFVADGIHGQELGCSGGGPDPRRLASLFERSGLHPIAALPELRW